MVPGKNDILAGPRRADMREITDVENELRERVRCLPTGLDALVIGQRVVEKRSTGSRP